MLDPGAEAEWMPQAEELEAIKELVERRGPHLDDALELEDSEIEETVLTKFFLSSQAGSKIQRKDFYQFLVQKINGLDGIRRLHRLFRDERRALLNVESPGASMSDDYFGICTKYIPLLEMLRKANLARLYQQIR